jgi:hypothetical protein
MSIKASSSREIKTILRPDHSRGIRSLFFSSHCSNVCIVENSFSHRIAERSGHLRSGQMLASDANSLSDQFASPFENAMGASTDIPGSDTRYRFLFSHLDLQPPCN